MRPSEDNQRLDEAISRTAPRPGPVPDFGRWQQTHPAAVEALRAGAGQGRQSAGLIPLFHHRLTRVAAALLLTLGLGFAIGRLSWRQQLDRQRLQAELEASVIATMDQQLRSALETHSEQLRQEIAEQLRLDLARFASQTLAITDQRISDLTQSIAAVRWVDRQRVATALEQIELNRLGDRARLASGLQALASQADQPPHRQTN